jgi:hypothetical protein
LYDSSSRLLDNWQSTDFGYGISQRWKAPASGTYYLEIKPAQSGLSGTDMAYKVYYGPGVWISMPEIHR